MFCLTQLILISLTNLASYPGQKWHNSDTQKNHSQFIYRLNSERSLSAGIITADDFNDFNRFSELWFSRTELEDPEDIAGDISGLGNWNKYSLNKKNV